MSVFVDRNYLFPLLVMLQSFKRNVGNGRKVIIGSFDEELTETDLRNVRSFADKMGLDIDVQTFSQSQLDELGAIDGKLHFGLAAFGRLALQGRNPERHFYSDVDVLFTHQASLVLDAIPASSQVGFVSQSRAMAIAGIPTKKENTEFFAGFIAWPELKSRPLISLRGGGRVSTPFSEHDQALLNITLGGNFQELDPRLCQLDNVDLTVDSVSPGIVHFFGNWKPWQADESSRLRCREARCLWNLWFDEEEVLLSALPDVHWQSWVTDLRASSQKKRSVALARLVPVVRIFSLLPGRRVFLALLRKAAGKKLHLIH